MAKLIIFEEFEDADTIFEDFDLTAVQRMLIGSSHDCELVLESPDIDPTHASLELRDRHWILQDLGSPGGTVVNGQEIAGPYRLHHQDLIELGHIKIKFDAEEEVQDEPAAADEPLSESEPAPMRGRVWFAGVAGGTLAVIFFILLLLIVADYLGLLEITDLLPPWLGLVDML